MPSAASIGRIDRRIIFVLIFVAVVWPLIQPMRLPIDVSPPVQSLYDAVEAVPPGSIVMLGGDYSPDTMPELQPMAETFIRHAFSRDLRVVVACLWPASPPLVETRADAAGGGVREGRGRRLHQPRLHGGRDRHASRDGREHPEHVSRPPTTERPSVRSRSCRRFRTSTTSPS